MKQDVKIVGATNDCLGYRGLLRSDLRLPLHHCVRGSVLVTPEPLDALVERVQNALDEREYADPIFVKADAALTELAERVKELESKNGKLSALIIEAEADFRERLKAAETPAWDRLAAQEVKRLTAQRDELVEALEVIADEENHTSESRRVARAALAKLNEPTGPVGHDTC